MTLTPEQLSELAHGLGGSDAFTYGLPGRDSTRSLLDLWRAKTGNAPPRRDWEDPRMAWGSRLEPVMREWAGEKLGRTILKPVVTYRHPEYPFLIGHLDGLVENTEPPAHFGYGLGGFDGLEIKCADKLLADQYGEGEDEVPIRHVLQCHNYMLVTGIRRFYLAALIGGNDARMYTLNYDEAIGRSLLEQAKKFWAMVEARTPPEPTTLADVQYLWPTSQEHIAKASDSVLGKVQRLTELRRAERKAAREADELEVAIKAYMGERAILADTYGHRLLTWRTQAREHVDIPTLNREHPDLVARYRVTTNVRVFRLK